MKKEDKKGFLDLLPYLPKLPLKLQILHQMNRMTGMLDEDKEKQHAESLFSDANISTSLFFREEEEERQALEARKKEREDRLKAIKGGNV